MLLSQVLRSLKRRIGPVLILRIYRVSAAKPLSALILAAGQSRRFGGGKLRALWNGRPLILWALEAALAAPVTEVILVWGGDPLILPLLPPDPRLKTVHCEDHLQGMGASLAAGLAAIDPNSAGAYIFLGDMPRVPIMLMVDLCTLYSLARSARRLPSRRARRMARTSASVRRTPGVSRPRCGATNLPLRSRSALFSVAVPRNR